MTAFKSIFILLLLVAGNYPFLLAQLSYSQTGSRVMAPQSLPQNKKETTSTKDPNRFYKPADYLFFRWNPSGAIWDSIEKHTLLYFDDGTISLDTKQSWTANPSAWTNDAQTQFAYDLLGNRIFENTYSWNGSGWELQFRIIREFDAQNNKTLELSFNWNTGTARWDTTSGNRLSYLYDSKNQILQKITETWTSWASFENTYKFVYTYDVSGNISTYVFSVWNSGTWKYSQNFSYTYNNQNELVNRTVQEYVNSNWRNFYRNIDYYWHSYPDGEHDSITTQTWNGSAWENYNKSTCSYGLNHSSTCIFSEWWNNLYWVDKSRTRVIFDSQNNEILNVIEPSTGSSFAIFNGDSTLISYDSLGNIVDKIRYRYNSQTLQFELADKYEYSNFIYLPRFQGSPNVLVVWPNPASQFINVKSIKSAKGNLFFLKDLQGKQIRTFEWMGNECQEFPLDGLEAGLYLLDSGIYGSVVKVIIR